MVRLRENFKRGTITDNPLLIGGTTLNSAELSSLQAVTAPDIAVVVLDPAGDAGDPEIVHVTAHTAASTSATITRGQEGSTARQHESGTIWEHSPTEDDWDHGNLAGLADDDHPVYAKAASVVTYADRKTRTAGTLTLNSTTWANVDTGLDIVLTAVSGQWVECGLSGIVGSEAVELFFDIHTIVAGSPVNSIADAAAPDNTHQGVSGWRNQPSVVAMVSGSMMYQLAAGDISAGTVTLRVRYRTETATNKSLIADATRRFQFWARNHG